MKLSFSTLGCQKWSLGEIMQKATEYGYDGIELRGIKGEMSLPKSPELAVDRRKEVKKELDGRKLAVACVDTSCALSVKPELMKGNLAEAEAHMQLAVDLGSRYIRVFGGGIPDGKTREYYFDFAIETIGKLSDLGKKYGVSALIETHDELTLAKDLGRVLDTANKPFTGALWDIGNPLAKGEKVAEGYEYIKKHLKHIHFKDVKVNPDGSAKHVMLGNGILPVKEIVDLLKKNNYDGFISLEWEKHWHPELEEPEIAFPDFVKKMRRAPQKTNTFPL